MRLSQRERFLGGIVGMVVFIVFNLMLMSAFSRRYAELRGDLVSRKSEWSAMQMLLGEQDLWAQRDAVLDLKQPKLINENAAGVELLDVVRGLAQRHQVALDNESFPGIANTKAYRSVPVLVDAHSTWPDLIAFLYSLQRPDQFIVCETANLQVDPADPSKMLGHFKIARWYAP